MLNSLESLQFIYENYPDFVYLSDYYYDTPESRVLLCVEMYHFGHYIWDLYIRHESLDFSKLRYVMMRLILEGDEAVSSAVTLCFNETLDDLDDKAGNPDYTRVWLNEMGSVLEYYLPFLEKRKKYLGL